MKKIGSLLLVMLMFVTMLPVSATEAAQLSPGTYTVTVPAMWGPMTVEATFGETTIDDVKVVEHVETPGISEWPISLIPERVIEYQSIAVETVSGATLTSRAILRGVEQCLTEAGGTAAMFTKEMPAPDLTPMETKADVVIVGGGGAGLAASIAATEAGASVILIEKAGFLGGNSIVAGGIYNTADPEMQLLLESSETVDQLIIDAVNEAPVSDEHAALMAKVKTEYEAFRSENATALFDSAAWHALQTWNGGDRVGTLSIIETMTDNALDGLNWVKGMGMEFTDRISQGAGALYERTHFPVAPNGTGYMTAFNKKLAEEPNYSLMMETTVNDLIMDGEKVVGVKATDRYGRDVTVMANKSVILATGGFAGNVELRMQYCEGEKWPDLGPSLNTSNMPAVTGDGIFMAEKAGAALVNMEQIQLLHVCNPITGITSDICGPQSAAGYLFINKEGNRFVREDGRRDDISKSIIEQTDGMMYLLQSADVITDPNTDMTLGNQSVQYMLDNNLSGYVVADTLEELAGLIGVDATNLVSSVDAYNECVDTQTPDEFGRTLLRIRQDKGPWYAYPRKPAAHHTMGGVLIDTECRALNADGQAIPGLFCAGEITGVVHGGNRLGGNAIVDFVVYGRIAGEQAAK